MIPKVIHCCWLGGGAKDALLAKCCASWGRHAPDFKVKEWVARALYSLKCAG